jgi:methionine sulfoxide reductase heme-binding subunit
MQRLSERAVVALKVAVFVAALLPVARLALGALVYPDWLGANPAEYITRSLGDWALRFLLITLAVTPARRLTGAAWLVRFRRMLGLFAFFYVLLHVSSYVSFDMVFDFGDILKDIAKRPFITVGFVCLVLLVPLAVTSTNAMVKRLGARRWQVLHRLVYVIGPLAVLHFWWMVKRDLTEPIIYAVILAILLGYRIAVRRRAPGPVPARAAPQTR